MTRQEISSHFPPFWRDQLVHAVDIKQIDAITDAMADAGLLLRRDDVSGLRVICQSVQIPKGDE